MAVLDARRVALKSRRPLRTLGLILAVGAITLHFGARSWVYMFGPEVINARQELERAEQMVPVAVLSGVILFAAIILLVAGWWSNRALRQNDSTKDATRTESTPQVAAARKAEAWRRFWARNIDYVVATVLVVIVLPEVAPSLSEWLDGDTAAARLAFPVLSAGLWTIPEAFLVHWLGTSPGKWAFGVRIETRDGRKLSLGSSIKRSLRAWSFGAAFNSPFALYSVSRAYDDLLRTGVCRWDRELAVRVGRLRLLAAGNAVVLASAVAWIGVITYEAEDETARIARSEVELMSRHLVGVFAEKGVELQIIAPTRTFELGDGEVRKTPLTLKRGGVVVVIGGCDGDCEDLDIAIQDPTGEIVGADREADARPVVSLEPNLAGEYVIVTTMNRCKTVPCAAGYSVLHSDSAMPAETAGSGTGFAVDPVGGILTANHVVEGTTKIRVVFSDGTQAAAVVERRSPANDLALLRVSRTTESFLPLADPESVVLGRAVFVMGFPLREDLGEEVKFTEGSVTALSGFHGEAGQIQFSAPIQPGNSGGPVVDAEGRVVAIVRSRASGGEPTQLVNWATKSSIATTLIGSQARAWKASNREDAIERARRATVLVIVE